MNIFIVDSDPVLAAQMLCDQHVACYAKRMATKVCTGCGKDKSLEAFYIDRRTRKHMSRCKACRGASVVAWQQDEAVREARSRKEKERRDRDPVGLLLSLAKQRAKRRGLPFTLVREDIVIPERCPVLGLLLERGQRKLKDASPTLDRLDPCKGYVPGNIAVISWRANKVRGDATREELRRVLRYVERKGLG